MLHFIQSSVCDSLDSPIVFYSTRHLSCTMKSLSICMWNIQGLKSSTFGLKSLAQEFKTNLTDIDIIILQETWCKADTITHCPSNYREIIVPSQKHSNTNRGRESGGLIIWYKSDLHIQIDPLKMGKYYIWLKLKKELLLTDRELFVCTIYIPPSESPYSSEDTFLTLETEISYFQAQGNVLICGDTNARTGTLTDLTDPQVAKYITNGNISNTFTLPHRNDSDQVINKSRRELVQLCQSLSLYFVNGRVRGDSLGRFTYCSPLGHSTVDYMITDLEPSSLSSSTVKPLTPLSDHSQITLFIKRSDIKMVHTQPNKLYNIRNSYRWDQNSTEQYQRASDTPKIQTLLDNFLDCTYSCNKENLNLAVNNINNTFRQTAKEAQLKLTKNKPKTITNKNWFDTDCKMIRKNLRMLSNQKHRDPHNADLGILYCETLKLYKRTLRLKKQQYNKQQLTIIEEAINTNNFWQHWKNLKKTSTPRIGHTKQ